MLVTLIYILLLSYIFHTPLPTYCMYTSVEDLSRVYNMTLDFSFTSYPRSYEDSTKRKSSIVL